MVFRIFILAMDLLVPAAMILIGRMFLRKPPREINASFGYRTRMSMRNQDTWRFAHAYCGRLWLRTGPLLALPAAVPLLCFPGGDAETVGTAGFVVCMAQVAVMLLTLLPTERALRRTFDRFGRRKE